MPFPEPTCLFGQHQDTALWNNQFLETKLLGLPVSRRMRALVYLTSRDEVDVDAFHKGFQYTLEKLGKSRFGFESTAVSNLKAKDTNELVDYSRAPCLGADQTARGLWERDCLSIFSTKWSFSCSLLHVNGHLPIELARPVHKKHSDI